MSYKVCIIPHIGAAEDPPNKFIPTDKTKLATIKYLAKLPNSPAVYT